MRSSRRRLHRLRAGLRRKAGTDVMEISCRIDKRYRNAYPTARCTRALRLGVIALTSAAPLKIAEGVYRDQWVGRGCSGWEWR